MKTLLTRSKLNLMFLMLILMLTVLDAFSKINEEWTLITTQNNVSVYYKATNCDGNSVVLVRIVNNSNESKTITWNLWGAASTPRNITILSSKDVLGGCATNVTSVQSDELVSSIPTGKTIADIDPSVSIN